MKTITILGSTGTIGQNTLSVIAANPGRFAIENLVAHENAEELAEQAKKYAAKCAIIANEQHYAALKNALTGSGIEALAGEQAVIDAASQTVDITMSAIVGAAGLKPTLAAIRASKVVALANKESLVCAGPLLQAEVKKSGCQLIPVDSEHNAIFQALGERDKPFVERVTITASGGPFRDWDMLRMQSVTPEEAIRHPNWHMGAKISVDSATLMNKGLELIEAQHLFDLKPEQLAAIIHPQSIVHCLIQLIDGSVLAQMSLPDMRTPIAHALAWPERMRAPVETLELASIGALEFFAPDVLRFPAIRLAREAMQAGGSAPVILNAANEIAVGRFLAREIAFTDIAQIVEKALEKGEIAPIYQLQDVFAVDQTTRNFARAA